MSLDRVNTSSLPQDLTVHVETPETIVFSGKAVAITSVNKNGKFDVLPYHTNFISLIKDLLIIHESKVAKKELPIQGGIMKVYENTIHIFLGIKTTP